jgi:predicted metal-dependent HD superfamily phosphohydrolase
MKSKDTLIQNLRLRYAEKTRAYHTQAHVDAMLRWMAQLKEHIVEADVFEWAVWYHDAVYEPTRNDNEEKSALLAQIELTQLGLSISKINSIVALIRATQTHEPTGESPDCALFLDVDMSILGTPSDVYKTYTQLIREEYHWVPHLLFKKNRQALLHHWLSRDAIFYTAVMRDKLEAQARLNLQAELVEAL